HHTGRPPERERGSSASAACEPNCGRANFSGRITSSVEVPVAAKSGNWLAQPMQNLAPVRLVRWHEAQTTGFGTVDL
ncbi:MAG: hypothetical protein KKC79_18825, partial [Gammaproteobacteria bacterium]|nr:hypothetical protein [Gammaproteobacteria bacterium]